MKFSAVRYKATEPSLLSRPRRIPDPELLRKIWMHPSLEIGFSTLMQCGQSMMLYFGAWFVPNIKIFSTLWQIMPLNYELKNSIFDRPTCTCGVFCLKLIIFQKMWVARRLDNELLQLKIGHSLRSFGPNNFMQKNKSDFNLLVGNFKTHITILL